jgi:hypothetical protein
MQDNKNYDQAIICFKKILLYSWVYDYTDMEIEAYTGLSK